MDIALEKKRFTPKRIALIIGAALLIGFIIFILLSSSGSTKLNIDRERISIHAVKNGVF